MRIRMCRFMLEGMAMHRAVRAFISTLMAQLFDAHSRAGCVWTLTTHVLTWV